MSEILGVLFAVFVGIIMIPNLMGFAQSSNDNIRNAVTAQQQKELLAAATIYNKQNALVLQSLATPTTPVTITVAMLQAPDVKLLPASFSAVNPYSQTWQVQVMQPSPAVLQALVMSTGGQAIPDKHAAKIAAIVGASGGFIPKNDSGTYPGGSANAYGAFSGWQVSTANYTSVSGGHPAALLTVSNGQVVSNYLYRNAVPGQPQLNQMNTALGMAGNDINSAGTVNGSSLQGGRIASGSTIAASGTMCAGNSQADCAGAGGVVMTAGGDVLANASVNAAGDVTTRGQLRTNGGGWFDNKYGGGFYMNDALTIRAYGDKNLATGGQVQAGGLNVDGNATVGSLVSNGSLSVSSNVVVGGDQVVVGKAKVTQELTLGQTATEGAYCGGKQGSIARDSNNDMYICR